MIMADRDTILRKIPDIEDKLLVSKILDKAVKAEKTGKATWTDFLDPHQRSVVERALAGCRDVFYAFYGGYEEAERAVVVFSSGFVTESDMQACPLQLLRIHVKGPDELTHRDFLGALMSLGIKREKIGDIVVGEQGADILVLEEIGEYIGYNLQKIGRSRIEIQAGDLKTLEAPVRKSREIRATVASLRLDCVAGAAYNLSRAEALEIIRSQRLNLNWEVADSASIQVKEGDTFSVRGMGRAVLQKIGGTTRKDRISIVISRLI